MGLKFLPPKCDVSAQKGRTKPAWRGFESCHGGIKPFLFADLLCHSSVMEMSPQKKDFFTLLPVLEESLPDYSWPLTPSAMCHFPKGCRVERNSLTQWKAGKNPMHPNWVSLKYLWLSSWVIKLSCSPVMVRKGVCLAPGWSLLPLHECTLAMKPQSWGDEQGYFHTKVLVK